MQIKKLMSFFLSFLLSAGLIFTVSAEESSHTQTWAPKSATGTDTSEITEEESAASNSVCDALKEDSTVSVPVSSGSNTDTVELDSLTASSRMGTALPAPSVQTSSCCYSVTVTWTPITGADGYRIFRRTADSGWNGTAVEMVTGTVSSYTDTNAVYGTTYFYTVRPYQNTDEGRIYGSYDPTGAKGRAYLATPTLKGAAAVSYDKIKLSWEPVPDAEGYYVYRKTVGGSWQRIQTVSGENTVSYTDSNPVTGTQYLYTVKAYSTVQGARIFGGYNRTGIAAKVTLPAPAVKTASSYNKIKISWNRITGADGYAVFRKVASSSWKRIATIKNGTTLSYTDTSCVYGTAYRYTVRPYRTTTGKNGYGAYNAAGVAGKAILATPVLKSAVSADYSKIKVSWTPVPDAAGYRIYRKTAGGSWSRIKTISGQTAASYTDATALTGTTYTYTVRAYQMRDGKTVLSAYNTTGKTAAAVLATPTLKNAVMGSYISGDYIHLGIEVTWTPVAGADGYAFYKKTASGWKRMKTLSGQSTTSYIDINTQYGETYCYTVRAYRKANGVNVYSGYDKKGISCKIPAYPDLDVNLPTSETTSCTNVTMEVINNGSKTLRIYSSGAQLIDYDYYSKDRNLVLAGGVAYQEIPAGSTASITFQVSGTKTRYNSKTLIEFSFSYDGKSYRCQASPGKTPVYLYP